MQSDHERTNITASFAEHLEVPERKTCTHSLWFKLELGRYRFSNCYIQGVPRKKQHHCFFRRAPIISRINDL